MNLHLLAGLFSTLVALTWRASWLIVVLVALRLLVRGRVPAQMWFGVWLVVALRLLLPFSFPTGWSPYNLAAVLTRSATDPSRAQATLVNAPHEPASAPTEPKAPLPQASMLPPVVASRLPFVDAGSRWSLEEKLAAVWLAGIGLLIVARLAGSWSFRRQLRDEVPVTDGRVAALIEMELKQSGGRARLMASETRAVDAPALYGLVRPRLLLPPGFSAKLTDDELRHVVCHELGHWRRRDLLAHGLMQAAVALHWFNPLAWLAARLAQVDCELACDEFVLGRELPGGPPAYGATLLKVLGMVRGQRRPVAVVAMLEGRGQLAQRIRRIAGYRATTSGGVIAGLVLVATLAVASLTREARAEEEQSPATAKPNSVNAPEPSVNKTAIPQASTPPVTTDTQPTAESDRRTEAERKAKAFDDLKSVADAQRKKVDQLQRALQEYKEKTRLVSSDQLRDFISETLKALNLEVQRTGTVKSAAELRLNQVKDRRSRGADLMDLPFIANQPLVLRLSQLLAEAKIALDTASQKYGERHPEFITRTRNVAATEKELQRAVDSVCRQVEADFEEAKQNSEQALQALERAKTESLALDRDVLQYDSLVRELRTNEQILQSIAARARDVAGAAGHEVAPPDAFNRKSGASGTLTLAGANSYTGGTTLSAGTLTVNSGAALADASTSGAFPKSGAGTLTLANTSTFAGTTTISTGPSQIGAGAATATRGSVERDGSTVISLDQDGAMSVNGKNVSEVQLLALLQEIHRIDPNVTVLIEADPKTQSAKLAAVMDSCRKAGLNKFSLQVR